MCRRVIFLGTSGDACVNSPTLCATKFFSERAAHVIVWLLLEISAIVISVFALVFSNAVCTTRAVRIGVSSSVCSSVHARDGSGDFLVSYVQIVRLRCIMSVCLMPPTAIGPSLSEEVHWGARLSDRDLQQPLHSAMPTDNCAGNARDVCQVHDNFESRGLC